MNDTVNDGVQGDTGSDGGNESWLDGLSDDLKNNETLKGYDGVESLAKDLVELKSNQPQIPDGPDSYQINIPEGFPIDDEVFKGYKGVAYEIGLTNEQADKLAGWQAQVNQQFAEKLQAEFDREASETTESLKKEWGNDYDKNIGIANRAISHFFGKEINDYMGDSGLGRNAAFIKGMVKIGKMISEDDLVSGDGVKPDNVKTTADGRPMLSFKDSG